ncbi:ABC transporter permease [bacterium]|nr:ABC transporter permease [bacterium]
MLLPWDYGVRNLQRRPLRTALTIASTTLAILLVLAVAAFVRGLSRTLGETGIEENVIVYLNGAERDLVRSQIPNRTPALLEASLQGIRRREGTSYVSPEINLSTVVKLASDLVQGEKALTRLGLLRGIMPAAFLVHREVAIVEGRAPGPGEVLVGRFVATKIGAEGLRVGDGVDFEGRHWNVSGIFAAPGTVYESEIWLNVEDLQRATRLEDVSCVVMTMESKEKIPDVQAFTRTRLDLELAAMSEREYYSELGKQYAPIRMLAWVMALLVWGGGLAGAANSMYASVAGRTAELGALQSIGFVRSALVLSLIQESSIVAAAATLGASAIALGFLNGFALNFTQGAFALRVDGTALLIGILTGVFLGILGALPPALRALKKPIAIAIAER